MFLINLLNKFFPKKLSRVFGDAKYNFSHKSMKLLFEHAGLKIDRVMLNESGKKIRSFRKKLIYKSTLLLSKLFGIKIPLV